MEKTFIDYRFSEDLFRNIRKIKMIISLAMILIGILFFTLINPLASLTPVETRPFYITIGIIILSGGGLYSVIIGLKTLFEALKNSNVIKNDRITYKDGLIKYYKTVYYQSTEQTNSYTEHYVYKIKTENIERIKKDIFSCILYGNFTTTLQEKDLEDNKATKTVKKIKIPLYFNNFEELLKTIKVTKKES